MMPVSEITHVKTEVNASTLTTATLANAPTTTLAKLANNTKTVSYYDSFYYMSNTTPLM